jgi:hypothetical protein
MPTPKDRFLRRTREAAHDFGFSTLDVDHGIVVGDDSRKVEKAAEAYCEQEPDHETVWRDGNRIRRRDGTGYSDRVPDDQIRAHLFNAADTDPEHTAFALAVLAIRDFERTVALKKGRQTT